MIGRINWDLVHQIIRSSAEFLCNHFFPAGKKNGHEWEIGNLAGEPGDSCKFELEGPKAGLFIDFATKQRGTFLDALMAARGLDLTAAAEAIGNATGRPIDNGAAPNPASQYQKAAGIDWFRDYKVGSKQLEELAAWRGYAIKFCAWLVAERLIGRSGAHWVFPVFDSNGTIVAVHKRLEKNKWIFSPTLKSLGIALTPLVIGDPTIASRAIAGESQWDLFAILEVLGIHEGEPIIGIASRGAGNAGVIGKIPSDFYAIGQNDQAGTEWLEALKTVQPFRFIPVPAHYHDANDWIKTGQAARAEFVTAFQRARPYKWHIPDWLRAKSAKNLDPTKPAEILAGVFCEGQIIAIQGASKARKTYFVQQLLFCIANGLPFLGFATAKQKVLDIDFESQEGFSAERLKEIRDGLGAGNLDDLWILLLRGKTEPFDLVILEKLADVIDQEDYRVFGIDPIYKLLGDRQENEARGVAQMLAPFVAMAHNLKVTMLYAHHYAKGDQTYRDAIDRGSGSGVFARLPDAIFNLSLLEQEPNTYRLEIIQRNYPEIPAFGVRWKDGVFIHDDTLDPKLKKGSTAGGKRRKDYIEPERALKFITALEEIPKSEFLERLFVQDYTGKFALCGQRRAEQIVKVLIETGRLIETTQNKKKYVRKP